MTDRLSRVAEHLRRQAAEGEQLDELGRAALQREDTRELERELEVDAEAARTAYEPLGADFKARIAERVRESMAAERASARVRRLWPASALFAAAAALIIGLASRGGPEPIALARYELEIENPVAAERSSTAADTADEPIGLAPGSTLHLVLRPERAVSERVGARVFVHADAEGRAGGEIVEVPAKVQAAAVGALRLEAKLPGTLPALGDLIVVVGTMDALEQGHSIAEEAAESGAGWQRFERGFRIAGVRD